MRRIEIVRAAQRWVGTPYHHQGSLRGVGCDCLGLVRGVWRDVVGQEPERAPPYTPDWAEARGEETLLGAAQRHFVAADTIRSGSVIVFRWRASAPAKHVGIAVSETRFIHAYDAAGKVVEATLSAPWRRRLAAIFDFPGVSD